MSIKVISNFDLQSKLPNFEREQYTTVNKMKLYPEASLSEGCICYVIENSTLYIYSNKFEFNNITGKWKRLDEFLFKDTLTTNFRPIKNIITKNAIIDYNQELYVMSNTPITITIDNKVSWVEIIDASRNSESYYIKLVFPTDSIINGKNETEYIIDVNGSKTLFIRENISSNQWYATSYLPDN